MRPSVTSRICSSQRPLDTGLCSVPPMVGGLKAGGTWTAEATITQLREKVMAIPVKTATVRPILLLGISSA